MNVDTLRIAVLVVVVLLLAAAAVARPYALAALAGSAAAAFAALSAWFYGLTGTTTPPVLKVAGMLGLVVTAALAGWVTVAAHRRHVRSLVVARALLAVAALGLAILLLNPLRSLPPSSPWTTSSLRGSVSTWPSSSHWLCWRTPSGQPHLGRLTLQPSRRRCW